MPTIRPETSADRGAVRAVNEHAFGRAAEADLVDALRRVADPVVSLVAEVEGQVVGHIVFSPVTIESIPGSPPVMGLAPMAVHPDWQRQGIGVELVREGLQACQQLGTPAVVVLGHPSYYPRFGFTPAADFGLQSEYDDAPPEAFMALELQPGALDDAVGTVAYHPAFGDVA